MAAEHRLSYRVFFHEPDHEWVGVCEQFKSLSHLDRTPAAALAGIEELIGVVIDELRTEGRPMPWDASAGAR